MPTRGRKIQQKQGETGVKASPAKGWPSQKGQSAWVVAQLCRPPIGIRNRPKVHSGIAGA